MGFITNERWEEIALDADASWTNEQRLIAVGLV